MKTLLLILVLATSMSSFANDDYEQPIDETSPQSLEAEDLTGRDTASESPDFNQEEFESPVAEEYPG